MYDRGISVNGDVEARRGVLVGYRTGDVWSSHIAATEPLQKLVSHFAECIRENKVPLTDGEAGLRVVRILQAAQRIADSLRYADAVTELRGGAPAVARMRTFKGPIPGIYPDGS